MLQYYKKEYVLNKNNFIISLLTTSFLHIPVLLYVLFSSSANNIYFNNWGFIFFSLNNIILVVILSVPIMALIKGELYWCDIYSIISIFLILITTFTYWGYVFDPEYIQLRFISLSPHAPYLSNNLICYYLGLSEFLFSLFSLILLITNNKIIKSTVNSEINKIENNNIMITGFIILIFGIYGFYMSWKFINFFSVIFFNIGNIDLRIPQSGYAKYRIFIDISILFFTFFGIALINKFLFNYKIIKKYVSIFLIFIPIGPMLIYGDRTSIVQIILLNLLLINHFLFSITKKFLLLVFTLCAIIIFLLSILRGNPYLKDQSIQSLTMVITGKISLSEYRYGKTTGFFYDLDRVVTLASLLEYHHRNGEYIYGKSLIAAPARFIQDILERTKTINKSDNKWWQGSDYSKFWLYGSVNPYVTGHPPSLPAEFYFQFGFVSFIILTYLYGKLLFYIRDTYTKKISTISFFILSIIIVNQLVLIGADITYIIQIIIYQILPILALYKIIELVTNKNLRYSLMKI